jgi:acyl carrier protein
VAHALFAKTGVEKVSTRHVENVRYMNSRAMETKDVHENDMQEKLAGIVRRISKSETTPEPDESLFDAGYLDSFALVDMVSEIEREFHVKIPDADLTPRRFDSLARIGEYLTSRVK